MDRSKMITVATFCQFHEVEDSFLFSLQEVGLIEIFEYERESYLAQDSLLEFERMVRLYKDFELSPEGIDVVLGLIKKVEALQDENFRLLRKINRLDL